MDDDVDIKRANKMNQTKFLNKNIRQNQMEISKEKSQGHKQQEPSKTNHDDDDDDP